jgi:hypothetical protein
VQKVVGDESGARVAVAKTFIKVFYINERKMCITKG